MKKLLDLLEEQQDYIFITVQIVEEVQRNKLQLAAILMTERLKQLELPTVNVPDRLFEISRAAAANLRKKLNDINQGIKALNSELVNAAVQTLQRISRSDDKVSQVLHVLFDRAIKDTPEEFQRATNRRERGNPPGKPGDPVGDQLTWEQLLSHCKGKSKLWIISVDRDYYSEYAGKLFLNPLLYQDLGRVSQPPPEVFCFDDLDEGLRDFVKVME